MFNRKLATFLLLAILAGVLARQAATGQEFSRRAMLENLTNNIILPLHQAFLDQTAALQTTAYAFRDAPTLEGLEALQQEWRETAYLWYQVAMFRLGRLTFVYHSRVANDAPLATQIITDMINGSDPFDATTIAAFGSNVVGLRAVEYLLFTPQTGNEAILAGYTTDPKADRRMLYLLITIDDLHATAQEIWNIWSPEGQNFAQEFIDSDDASSVQESISMLANQMMETLETTVNMTLGWPLGTVAGEIRPDLVEARYSHYSREQLQSFFEILHETFTGGSGPGLDDYLDFLSAMYNDVPLSQALDQQLMSVLDAVKAIEEPLDVALVNHPESVQHVYNEGRQLIVLMKADMVSQMGITITFNDNDGD